MRTTLSAEPVHVIYRRIDDDFLDPVHFLPDSVLGVPGLVNAARAGNVTIANGIGNGVADDKGLYPYVPTMIRYYLNEEPVLPNVETYDLQDAEAMHHVIDNIYDMVVKPVAGKRGYGIVVGPRATDEEFAAVIHEIQADPRGWIAQPVVGLSTCPTVMDDGSLAGRHVDLRPFAVNQGEGIWVLPGGLTRVALVQDSLVVNSSQGGGTQDTWVLAGARFTCRCHSPVCHADVRQRLSEWWRWWWCGQRNSCTMRYTKYSTIITINSLKCHGAFTSSSATSPAASLRRSRFFAVMGFVAVVASRPRPHVGHSPDSVIADGAKYFAQSSHHGIASPTYSVRRRTRSFSGVDPKSKASRMLRSR